MRDDRRIVLVALHDDRDLLRIGEIGREQLVRLPRQQPLRIELGCDGVFPETPGLLIARQRDDEHVVDHGCHGGFVHPQIGHVGAGAAGEE
jgi:hypothetical protein